MINVAEILKDVPKGTKLYSPIFGECVLSYIGTTAIKVNTAITFDGLTFDEYGRIFPNGECLLFPSKGQKSWGSFTIKKEDDFKPFDKVVVRDTKLDTWTIDFFSYKDKSCEEAPYTTINGWYTYCLPYNEETAKLIGTTYDYVERY